jgi:hypothetical protein
MTVFDTLTLTPKLLMKYYSLTPKEQALINDFLEHPKSVFYPNHPAVNEFIAEYNSEVIEKNKDIHTKPTPQPQELIQEAAKVVENTVKKIKPQTIDNTLDELTQIAHDTLSQLTPTVNDSILQELINTLRDTATKPVVYVPAVSTMVEAAKKGVEVGQKIVEKATQPQPKQDEWGTVFLWVLLLIFVYYFIQRWL